MCNFSKDIQIRLLIYTVPLPQAVNADYSWKEEIINMIVSTIHSVGKMGSEKFHIHMYISVWLKVIEKLLKYKQDLILIVNHDMYSVIHVS